METRKTLQVRQIGRRLEQARIEANLSQQELADKVGVDRSTISLYESGKRSIGLDVLDRLSCVLGKPLEYFLGIDTGLSEDEAELLYMYRALSERNKRLIRDIIRIHYDEERSI